MSEYRIFISHKDEELETAQAVKRAISRYAGQIECFIAKESITPGEDWRERLRQELQETDLLLLLFTSPTRNWDWCLYEAGLFTRLRRPEERLVVCLHEGREPPNPLLDRQAVQAEPGEVASFLSRLIRTTEVTGRDEPFNDNVTDEDLEIAALEICERFGAAIQPSYCPFRLVIDLPAATGDGEGPSGIPPDATVSGSDASMRIFGRTRAESWEDLVAEHRDRGEGWLQELDDSFARTCRGQVSRTVTQTFASDEGARIFRPELYRVDLRGRTPVRAVVILTEEIAPAKVGGALFNQLRVTERLEHEVFSPLDEADEPDDEGLQGLVHTVDVIEHEAATHGVFDGTAVDAFFPGAEEQRELREAQTAWDEGTTRMRTSSAQGDADGVISAMRELRRINAAHRARIAARYAEVVAAT